jgi:FRG domain
MPGPSRAADALAASRNKRYAVSAAIAALFYNGFSEAPMDAPKRGFRLTQLDGDWYWRLDIPNDHALFGPFLSRDEAEKDARESLNLRSVHPNGVRDQSSMKDRSPRTEWKSIYNRYVQLERGWSVLGATEPVARQLFRSIVLGRYRSEATILDEFRSFQLDPPTPDLLDEAFFLQEALNPQDRERPDGRSPDNPLEDVYAAALSMLPYGFWVERPDRDQVYRGQRNARWRTIPSLFRGEDMTGALDQLAIAAARIRATGLALDNEQVIAVAQHYSKKLNVATWLLDVTYDPRVALFFASDGGCEMNSASSIALSGANGKS